MHTKQLKMKHNINKITSLALESCCNSSTETAAALDVNGLALILKLEKEEVETSLEEVSFNKSRVFEDPFIVKNINIYLKTTLK